GLPGKDLAEVDFLVSQTYATAARDHDGFVVERVIDVGQSGVGTGRGLVDLGWTFHMQSLVRTFLVEDLDKLVEARLLLQEVGRRWLGGFFLQSEVHAFVTAILLGVTRLDALDADAQAQPPNGELA